MALVIVFLMTHGGSSDTRRPAGTAPAPQSGTNKVPGTPGTISHSAVVNFANVASREKLNPVQRPPAAVEEPIEPDEDELPRSVPAGAYAPTDQGRTSAPSLSAPSPGLSSSFQALDDDNSYIPPDTNGA